jgi:2,3-bisphosphoglycerate-independent phosphoglycerate mutase
VPFLLVTDQGKKVRVRESESLRDISPTILSLMELELPKQMTGGDLRMVAES